MSHLYSLLLRKKTTIRINYTNFTSLNIVKEHAAPVVSKIYHAAFSSLLIEWLTTEVQGLIVVSTNTTSSTDTSKTLSIVYTSPNTPFTVITEKDVPEGIIAGGPLTPVKAQVLLPFACTNGVIDINFLKNVFFG